MIINFFKRKSTTGKTTHYVRLSYAQQSTEIKLDFLWEGDKSRSNTYLNFIRQQLTELFNTQLLTNAPADPRTIKNLYLNQVKIKYLLETYWDYITNKLKPRLETKDIVAATFQQYTCTYNHLKDFLACRQLNDINIQAVDMVFVDEFDSYIRQFNAHNSTLKHLVNLKKIITYAINVKGYAMKNPFVNVKLRRKVTHSTFLEEYELLRIINKNTLNERLTKVRDIFVFQCFTGLAYSDMAALKAVDIQDNFIRINRVKTNETSVIFIYDITEMILKKYDYKLPVISNVKMNEYLKEIAVLCNITKKLTTHVARHTFATTVCLNNGVNMETVQKLLGHSSIKQTQHYAKLMTKSILDNCKKNNVALNKLYITKPDSSY